MSSERKATFTKGRTVYIYVGVIYWRLAVVISVWLCKSKASLWGESTCHCFRCTLWRQQWRHQNGNTTAETILNAWEQSKDSFFTCILFLYRHISTEITPFQLAEMSQGKPTCGDFFLLNPPTSVPTGSLSLMWNLSTSPLLLWTQWQ